MGSILSQEEISLIVGGNTKKSRESPRFFRSTICAKVRSRTTMKCSYACVVCVLSFIAGFLCLLTSAAVVIFAIWIWVTHDCVLDPEGIYVFQIIRAITVTLLVLLSVETIASGLLLAGIIKKKQLWIQFWIWYHSAVTALIAVTVASVERTHSVILYSILGAVVSFIVWYPAYLHGKHLSKQGPEQHGYQTAYDLIEDVASRRSCVKR